MKVAGQLDRADIEELSHQVVVLQSTIDQIASERDREAAIAVESVRKKYESKLKSLGDLILQKAEMVRQWLEENRAEVLGDERSFKTSSARIGFRWSPARLEPKPGSSWEKVLAQIKEVKRKIVLLGFEVSFRDRFIEVKETVNDRQIKSDLKAGLIFAGEIDVVMSQEEKFYIERK